MKMKQRFLLLFSAAGISLAIIFCICFRGDKERRISQLLNHLSAYANNHWTISSDGICILQADINGDGIKDIVEYGPGDGYYGKHEGRNGLTYYMESAGKETDFKRLFGLDIWEGELTPLWFCVRNTEKGNVVYFIYQDENEYEKRIDWYFADFMISTEKS